VPLGHLLRKPKVVVLHWIQKYFNFKKIKFIIVQCNISIFILLTNALRALFGISLKEKVTLIENSTSQGLNGFPHK